MQYWNFLRIVGLMTLCLGTYLTTAMAQATTDFVGSVEVRRVLQDNGLQTLLERIERNPLSPFPDIHTLTYCKTLPVAQQEECIQGNLLGQEVYSSLRKYQYEIQGMSLPHFSVAIKRLSLLRDKMWKTSSMGGVALADLTNRVIFWCLIYRATTGPLAELDQISTLHIFYRELASDWRTVAQASSKEMGLTVDFQAVEKATGRLADDTYSAREEPLILKYINIVDLLSIPIYYNFGTPILDVLRDGKTGSFFFTRIAGACESAAEPVLLQYYLLLIKQMRLQPDFAKHVPTAGDMKSPNGLWVKKMVLQYAPQSLGYKPVGCDNGVIWQDFYHLLSMGALHGDVQSRYTNETDADFEMRFQ